MIEQFRVRRSLAEGAEVARRIHKPTTEVPAHTQLTITRAVSGLLSDAIASARSRRVYSCSLEVGVAITRRKPFAGGRTRYPKQKKNVAEDR